MMKVQSIASIAVVAAVLVAGSANAQQITAGGDASPLLAHARVDGAPSFLSDDQRDKLRALKNQLTLDTAQKKAELKVGKSQLFALMSQPKVDKQAVLDLQSKLNTLKADLSNARVNFMLSAGDVLTAEQREKLRGRMMKRGFGGRHHGGGCGGPGRFHHGRAGASIGAGPVTGLEFNSTANLPST